MPRQGYKSTGNSSLPNQFIEGIEKLIKDPKYVREMRAKGFTRISRALVIRMALINYLRDKGINISQISEVEDR